MTRRLGPVGTTSSRGLAGLRETVSREVVRIISMSSVDLGHPAAVKDTSRSLSQTTGIQQRTDEKVFSKTF